MERSWARQGIRHVSIPCSLSGAKSIAGVRLGLPCLRCGSRTHVTALPSHCSTVSGATDTSIVLCKHVAMHRLQEARHSPML